LKVVVKTDGGGTKPRDPGGMVNGGKVGFWFRGCGEGGRNKSPRSHPGKWYKELPRGGGGKGAVPGGPGDLFFNLGSWGQ